ncbi:hypothetical protein [Streptomyces chartreusis]|uniref:hypothetical protein n=1 Tax=Streptomyces chartreusis TaxID=1969 RepID=UPI0037F667DF
MDGIMRTDVGNMEGCVWVVTIDACRGPTQARMVCALGDDTMWITASSTVTRTVPALTA